MHFFLAARVSDMIKLLSVGSLAQTVINYDIMLYLLLCSECSHNLTIKYKMISLSLAVCSKFVECTQCQCSQSNQFIWKRSFLQSLNTIALKCTNITSKLSVMLLLLLLFSLSFFFYWITVATDWTVMFCLRLGFFDSFGVFLVLIHSLVLHNETSFNS